MCDAIYNVSKVQRKEMCDTRPSWRYLYTCAAVARAWYDRDCRFLGRYAWAFDCSGRVGYSSTRQQLRISGFG